MTRESLDDAAEELYDLAKSGACTYQELSEVGRAFWREDVVKIVGIALQKGPTYWPTRDDLIGKVK